MLDWTRKDTWTTRQKMLNGMTYAEYLQSDEWRKIKAKASERPHYQKCWYCGATDGLDLHHRSYKWIGTPHAMRGLIAACRDCHGKIHVLANAESVSVRRATRRLKRQMASNRVTDRPTDA